MCSPIEIRELYYSKFCDAKLCGGNTSKVYLFQTKRARDEFPIDGINLFVHTWNSIGRKLAPQYSCIFDVGARHRSEGGKANGINPETELSEKEIEKAKYVLVHDQ